MLGFDSLQGSLTYERILKPHEPQAQGQGHCRVDEKIEPAKFCARRHGGPEGFECGDLVRVHGKRIEPAANCAAACVSSDDAWNREGRGWRNRRLQERG